MRKMFLQLLLVVVVLCTGGMLCACDEPTVEPKRISIETLPDNLSYTVGQELSLTGGQIKVVYEDDTTKLFPMSLATPNITMLNTATSDQQIILSFLGFTTRFGVIVEKGNISPTIRSSSNDATDGLPVVFVSYTGEPNSFNALDEFSLPDENLNIQYTYKNTALQNAQYVSEAPTNAGKYAVKIKISGSQNYNDINMDCYLVIQKSSLFDLTLNNQNLNFDSNSLNLQAGVFGTSANVSNYWKLSNNTLGPAPLPEDIRAELQYAYKPKNSGDYTNIPMRTTDGAHIVALNAGEYDMRISLVGDSNIEDYEFNFNYIVTQSDLVRGRDYDLCISDGTTTTLLSVDEALPTVAFVANKTYTLVLVSHVGAGVALQAGTIYYAGNSTSGDTVLQPTSAGQYKAVFGIAGDTNFKDITNETIRFVLE